MLAQKMPPKLLTQVCEICGGPMPKRGRGRPGVTCNNPNCREIRRLRRVAVRSRRRIELIEAGLCPSCGQPIAKAPA